MLHFFPGYCDGCHRPFLAAAGMVQHDAVNCPRCLAQARLIGGQAYGWADAAFFTDIADSVWEAGLAGEEAQRLAQGVIAASHDAELLQTSVQFLGRRLQSVIISRALVATKDSRLVLVVAGMLVQILLAIASDKSTQYSA